MDRSWVEISKSALVENIRMLRGVAGSDRILCAVVKANAYGHGIREVATMLHHDRSFLGTLHPRDTKNLGREFLDHGVQRGWFGVDSCGEALVLRDAGVRVPIMVLGYVPVADARIVVRTGARVTVATPETVRALASAARSLRRTIPVHVKVETGTQRQGVLLRDLSAFVRLIERSRGLALEGISTHLADVEDTGPDGFTHLQLERFERAVRIAERMVGRLLLRHASASAATMLLPDARFDLVRTGIALYGLWPSDRVRDAMEIHDPRGHVLCLHPVLTWKTIVGPMHWVPRGAPVGYGCTQRVRRRTRIAVLPVGYWDGYDRGLSSIGEVLIHGQRCKIIGRVCMNMIMVDVTDVPRVRLEDEVVLLGRQDHKEITADELARKIGTITYEVVTRINPFLPRMVS
ncbi:alanine racemase [Candidatus Uhrbacteria bacterium]|nr:alanine racemase [Candidatus Uhrbacteria bacterium]